MSTHVAAVVRVESLSAESWRVGAEREVHGVEPRLHAGLQAFGSGRQRPGDLHRPRAAHRLARQQRFAHRGLRGATREHEARRRRESTGSNYCVSTSNVPAYDARRFFTPGAVAFSSCTETSSQYMPAAGQVMAISPSLPVLKVISPGASR